MPRLQLLRVVFILALLFLVSASAAALSSPSLRSFQRTDSTDENGFMFTLAGPVTSAGKSSDYNSGVQAQFSNVELVGQIGGSTSAVAVRDNYAYVGLGPRLVVLNTVNPAQPAFVGQTGVLSDIVVDVAVAGEYAYIVAGYSGLRIINVSNPATPTEIGFYDTPGNGFASVAVASDYAYVADGNLRIINVSNPAAPTEVGFYYTPATAMDVAVVGNYAYVVDRGGLRIINVSNPATPIEVGFYNTPGGAEGVTVVGNYAYVAVGEFGLYIINVANPAAPTEVGFYNTPGWASSVAVEGNYAYVADPSHTNMYSGLRIINIFDPTAPIEVGFYDTLGPAKDVTAVGNHAYIADDYNGLRVIDISNPIAPTEVGFYNRPGWASSVAVEGNHAYVADGYSGLSIINASNPAVPTEVGFYDTPYYAGDVAVAGNYAYVADDYSGLRIINVANPAAPTEVGFYDTPGRALGVAVAGNYAYVADYTWRLRIINVANPAAPTDVGFYNSPGLAIGVTVVGNYAYVAEDLGLRIINVANPATPTEVGFYDTPGRASGVTVAGNYAYVTEDIGLRIINVTNPATPIEVGVYDTPGIAEGVTVAGNYAYVADYSGLRIINVANPAAPTEVGFYILPGVVAESVAVVDNYAYVADGSGGLFILRFTPTYSTSGKVLDSNSNPILGVTISAGSNITTTTDASGHYTITGLITGTYTITPTKVGHAFSPPSRMVNVPPDATGQNFIAQDTSTLVDPARSTIIVNPVFVQADGIASALVTVTLNNASGSPVPSKVVQIVPQRGSVDFVTQPSSPTNASGITTARVRSLTAGPSPVWTYVVGDGVRLNTPATITFGPTVPVPDRLRAQANSTVNLTQNTFDDIWDNFQAIVNEAIYFRGAIIENAFKLGTDLVGDLADFFSGVSDWHNGLPASRLTLPGWETILNSPAWKSEAVCKISNSFIKDATGGISSQAGQSLARITLRYGLYLLVAQKDNTCLGDLNEGFLTDNITLSNLIFDHLEHPTAEWPFKKLLDDLRTALTAQLNRVNTARIPPLSQSATDAYITDLIARTKTLSVFNDRIQDARWTLESVHAANEAAPLGGETLQTILRLSAKGIATYWLDGAGQMLVGGFFTAFDTYMNTNALTESILMAGLANSTIAQTTPESSKAAFDTVTTGLDRIVRGQSPHTPGGSISNVQHFSAGSNWGPFWDEQASYSTLTIQNTGIESASFYVVSRYRAQTTRLGYPWAFLWMSADSVPITLARGESRTVRIEYRNGSRGYSPVEHVQYLFPWGEVPASSIDIDLLGFNDTGLFFLDYDHTQGWNPTRVLTSIVAANRPISTAAMTIDEPIVVFVGGNQSQTDQTELLWVNNPFTVSVPVTVTQPVPAEVTPLDLGTGVLTDAQIVWTGYVAPLSSQMFSYTFSISATPGVSITLPSATLTLLSPADGILTDTADSLPFMLPWHISISRNTPDWIAPGSAANVIVTATNQLMTPLSGSFTLSVTTPTGSLVFAGTQALSMTGSQSQTLSFSLPVTMTIRDYQAIGLLETQGATGVMFDDPFSVGAPPPFLMTTASPVALDGTVAPGSMLAFAVWVTNTASIQLSGIMISNTIPSDLTIVPGTINDGGTRIGDIIRWNVSNLAPNAGRVLTYVVDIPADYVADGQWHYIESAATLTSQESPQTTGQSVTVLVISPLRVYLPLILRNH